MSIMSLARSVKSANAKGPPETSVAVRVATLFAVLIAANATLQQDVGTPTIRYALPAGLIVAFAFSYYARFRPGFVVKMFLAVGMLAASAHFVSQLGGIGQNAAAAQRPLAELFLWTQLLHSFDVPARRDLRFSLAASTVLIGVGGVLSIASDYAISLGLWSAAAVLALALMHRSELAELPRPTQMAAPSARSRRMPSRALATSLGLTLATSFAVAGLIFLFLPASGTARAFTFPASLPNVDRIPGGGLVNPSLGGNGNGNGNANDPTSTGKGGDTPRASFGYVGFSTEMDTAARGRPDDTIVMKVRASKPGFWRGQSFDHWDGRRWTASSDKTKAVSGDGAIDLPVFEGAVQMDDSNDFIQTVYVEKPGPNLIFGAASATKLYFPDKSVLVLPDGTIRAGVALGTGAVYTVVSKRPPADPVALAAETFNPLRAGEGLGQPARTVYTQLPADMPARIVDLASSITSSSPSLLGKVQAIEDWLGNNTTYSIDIPSLPANTDAVDHFLFTEKVGFCEQIASSLVVMMRSLGVPARLGVGYASGERNPFTGLYEVKASDAHAWAEIYFPGVGWLTFDPTANVPFADDGQVPLARNGLTDFLASRLGPIFSVVGRVVLGAGLLAGLGFIGWFVRRLYRRRQALAARSWPMVWNDRLDHIGRKAGHHRAAGQTARSFAEAVGFVGDDWDVAFAALDQAAYSDTDVPDPQRAFADQLLRRASETMSASRK
jgi:protein-glutamine gamma-glutamyltransferase